jgi:hypothetical protein
MNEEVIYEAEEISDPDPLYEENKLNHVLGELREHCNKYHLPFLQNPNTYQLFESNLN